MRQQVPHHRVPRPPAAPEQVPELPRAGVHRVDVEEGGARPHHVLLHEPPRLLPGGPLAAQQTLALGPWNNGKEVPRWGVAEIKKMSPSTTGRCYSLMRSQLTNHQLGIILDVQVWLEKLY